MIDRSRQIKFSTDGNYEKESNENFRFEKYSI